MTEPPTAEGPERDPWVEHDPTGTDYARRIARTARATGPAPARTTRSTKPPTLSGAGEDARDPQRVGRVLDAYIADRGWEVSVSIHTLLDRWADIVGESVAAHSTPETYDDGVVVVRTDSTAWATQLRTIASQIVAKLNEAVGDGSVQRVEVRGPDAPTWRHGRLRVKGVGPRDTYG
ncbi:MAG TPA: DciA family protein [Propionibacteriaceae bacterium]|nr:DciA family protein [Propionibacteriaceae bacterium]